jgi:alpha-L-rhamnosidase
MAPEWTDYNTRIQYQTYDVTSKLASGTTNSFNVIGAFVGEGWCYGDTDYTYYTTNYYGLKNPQFALLLNVINQDGTTNRITTDSNWKCSTNGAIRSASIYQGEVFDSRQEGASTNWSTPAYTPLYFTNSMMTPVSINGAMMSAQPNDPRQIVEYRQPIAIWTNTNEKQQFVTIFDMGQNMVGWCSLAVVNTNGAYGSGSNIVVRHAEVLQLNSNYLGANGPYQTNIYVGNLRIGLQWGAAQQETYVINSDTNQLFQPHFTYHGFRFVEVAAPLSVALKLTTNSVLGCVIHSGVPITGGVTSYQTNTGFSCSNTNITQLMQNAFWGLRGNLQGVFTACTQRGEREGYLYDEHIFSQTACFDVDMAAFLTKWIRDIRDAQTLLRSDGSYTQYAPFDALSLVPASTSDPGLQVGGIVFPWRLYQNYADTRMLSEHYASSSSWFGYLAHLCTNSAGAWSTSVWGGSGPTPNGVDWMEGDHFYYLGNGPSGWTSDATSSRAPSASTSYETWGTVWSAYSADTLAAMSRVLQLQALSNGDLTSASSYGSRYTYYTNMAAVIRTNYQNNIVETNSAGVIVSFKSVNSKPGYVWHSTSQGDCLSALYFDMLPCGQRASTISNVFSGYWGTSNYNKYNTGNAVCSNHVSTGYTFSSRGMLEMTRDGYTTNAYQLLLKSDFPSWLCAVTNGFTTCWEGWNTYVPGPGDLNQGYDTKNQSLTCSFNHLPFGAISEWIWRVVGGLNPDDNNPGFKNIIVKPEPGGGITNASASFNSIRGPVTCVWSNNLSAHTLNLNITVPANTTASIYIPSTNNLANITESGSAATAATPGVLFFYTTNQPSYTLGATVFQVGSGNYKFALTGYFP